MWSQSSYLKEGVYAVGYTVYFRLLAPGALDLSFLHCYYFGKEIRRKKTSCSI